MFIAYLRTKDSTFATLFEYVYIEIEMRCMCFFLLDCLCFLISKTTFNLKITDGVWFNDLQIKKFRDALAKHTPDRCSLGPTKGLEEKELLALSANKDLSFTYSPKLPQPAHASPASEEFATEASPAPTRPESLPLPSLTSESEEVSKERTLTTAGRWCVVSF